jgi:hypothetical protein
VERRRTVQESTTVAMRASDAEVGDVDEKDFEKLLGKFAKYLDGKVPPPRRLDKIIWLSLNLSLNLSLIACCPPYSAATAQRQQVAWLVSHLDASSAAGGSLTSTVDLVP